MIFKTPSPVRTQLAKLLVAATLPVWLVAAFLFNAYADKCADMERIQMASARSMVRAVDMELANIQAALLAFATSPNFATGDFDGVHRQALQLLKSYPGADIIVADAAGVQLVNTLRPSSAKLPRRQNLEATRLVFRSEKPVITNLFFGSTTGRPKVGVDVPVVLDGKVAYDLAMTFPSEYLEAVFLKEKLQPGEYRTVVDGKQNVVTRFPNGRRFVGGKSTKGLQQAMALAPEGTVDGTNLDGVSVFASFSRSAMSGWTVLVGAPKASLMLKISRWTWSAVVGAASISLFGVVLAIGYARRIALDIQSLADPAAGEGGLARQPLIAEIEEASTALRLRSRQRDRAGLELIRLNEALRREILERREAQEALTGVMLERAIILENAPIGISKTIGRTQVLVNKKMEEIFLYAKEEMESQPTRALYPSQEKFQEVGDAAYTQLAKGQIFETVQELVRKDGVHVLVRNVGKAIDPTDMSRGAIWLLEDITELKRSQELLREREERFKKMFFANGAVMLLIEPTAGTIVDANLAAERFYGYSRDALLSMNIDEINELPSDALRHQLRRANESDENRFVFRHKTCHSGVRTVEVHSTPIELVNSSLVFSIVHDITGKKAIEEELRRSRNLLNAVIEASRDAIYVKDTRGRYLLFNTSASLATGRSADEVLGRDDAELFPSDADGLIVSDWSAEIAGATLVSEDALTTANGDRRIFSSTKGPLFDENGRVFATFGISRDVTEQKKWETQIRELNGVLEARVHERTVELETALREQETFSYSVSHDLRSPLRAINGYLAIVMEDFADYLPPEALPFLNRSRVASATMGKLIDDILDLARVGRTELVKKTVDLSELARLVFAELQEMEPEREVEFTVSEGLTARGDKVLLKQALENLLSNAWKYSSREKKLLLTVGETVVKGHRTFFVKDNGIGFDMQYHDKIFGVFQRLHRTDYGGNGIGLATVLRIFERHGGSIWAEGKVGEGATFFFKFSR